MIRVLVVDDSAVMRLAISQILATDPEISVVGVAQDGQNAIEQVVALRPDVITMDVRMPIMDGLATTEHIMAYYPTPILALTASLSRFDINISLQMLEAGALDIMEKPASDQPGGFQQIRDDLVRRIKLLSRVRVVTHLRGRRRNPPEVLIRPKDPPRQPSTELTPLGPASTLIVIGASTGGPRVVRQILHDLPPKIGAAVLVVQHIARGFGTGLVEWLAADCRLRVRLAEPGQIAGAGTVTVAPDTMHLLIDSSGVINVSSQPAMLQCPSVDITMQRAAQSYGSRALGVLLTGMGRDGAAGLKAIRLAGGRTIAQSGPSCVIFGMPKAAIELGVVDEVLDPEQIAPRLAALTLRDLQ